MDIYLRINSIPMYDSENQLVCFFFIMEDISEWKKIDNSREMIHSKIMDLQDELENMHQFLNLYKVTEKKKDSLMVSFTNREKEIVHLINKGLVNKEIAYTLNLSEATIKKNISNIFLKTKTKNRLSLITHLKNKSYF